MKKTNDKGLAELTPNERNPRTMSPEKLQTLRDSLRFYGDLGGVILNKRTGKLIGGHQRVRAFEGDKDARVVIQTRLANPDAVGTVSYGYVETNGTRYGYREVDWDATKEKGAMLAANKFSGDFVWDQVKDIIAELRDDAFDTALTGFDAAEIAAIFDESSGDNPYTSKIESPVYTPTLDKKPNTDELVDTEKASELVARIKASKADGKTKAFLMLAAQRHLVFDYAMIAEFYAHSDKETQRLMEESALVIVDFKKAIENGFVAMTIEINEIQKQGSN